MTVKERLSVEIEDKEIILRCKRNISIMKLEQQRLIIERNYFLEKNMVKEEINTEKLISDLDRFILRQQCIIIRYS